MSEETIITDQAGEENRNESVEVEQASGTPRRNFLQLAIAAGSGLAIYSMVPGLARESWFAQRPNCDPAVGGQPLQSIMEIKSSTATRILRAVIKVLDEEKVYLGSPQPGQSGPSCNTGRMRYFSGYDQNLPAPGRPVWPKIHGVPGPGPTLRAAVGDTVQITLLNHVNTNNFPNTLDVAEHGQACDQATTFGQGNTYPGIPPSRANPSPSTPLFEMNMPNCFHGSSSTNLHFHGTHVSPSGISDNVLLNIRPSPLGRDGLPVVNEKTVAAIFDKIFAYCMHGHQPLLWTDWPVEWQNWQKQLLIQYDNTTTWLGKSPPPGGNGPSVLPQDEQLWFQNQEEMKPPNPQLPQYYIGGFPNCFTIPKWNGQSDSMGQAPGTHWYHAHKHGSTALNLANGMAGALIIEGDYDKTLQDYYTKNKQPLQERVLVLQQFSAVLGLLRPTGNAAPPYGDLVSVNGNYQPIVEMKPNQTQMWRFVNACHQKSVPLDTSPDIKWVQTAQDGVQLHQDNYNPDPAAFSNTISVPAKTSFIGGKWISNGSLAPGNRVDLLVRAPSKAADYPVTFGGTILMIVRVTGTAVNSVPFPTNGNNGEFPKQPGFLTDVVAPVGMVRREIRFNTTKTQFGQWASPSPTPTPIGTTGGRNSPTPSPAPAPPLMPNAPPTHTINGKQFSGEIDQYMKLGATEEWQLFNDTPIGGPAHPFHIHINPFQIVEWFDPALNLPPSGVKMGHPWVWWDNFAIPPGGWVKMLTRFVDYTGTYVFHCHILGHEDRGMMELVNVSPSGTSMKHK